MADLTTIRNAIAAQITSHTGLRALGQARDSISPPVAVVMPGDPLVTFGKTTDGTADMNLFIVIALSDAPPVEKTQRALDAYLGIGSGQSVSVAAAILADPTLGGHVHFAEPTTVRRYGRVEWAGVEYFGAIVDLVVGII